jgi:hypothetical protein
MELTLLSELLCYGVDTVNELRCNEVLRSSGHLGQSSL